MTWRELWKSTVTNLRALLGFTPPPPATLSSPRSSSPPAPLSKRKPVPLVAPSYPERVDPKARSPQTIELTSTRPIPPPSAPLRRKPILAQMDETPVDVALDAAAFAALRARTTEPLAITTSASTPDISWTRQGLPQVEQPTMDTLPNHGESIEAHDSSGYGNGNGNGDGHHHNGHNGNGYGGNGYGDNGFDNEDEEEGVALTTLLESLLFVASEPVDPRHLAQTLEQPLEIIELGLAELADYYQRSLRGLRLQRFNDKVQLVTTPAAAPFIEIFLNLDNSTRLSSPALETLAVIAYRQPVTRAQIEAVRGVDCAGVLRSLVQRGLVTEKGRMEGIGRPILYGVTEQFMQHFGLMEMGELPPLEETDADRLWAATVIDEQELGDPRPNKPQG